MAAEDKISIQIFKLISRAITESEDFQDMATRITQLAVGALDIKGCTIFILDPETDELEPLGSSGLSIDYLNKGPVLVNQSIGNRLKEESVVISDVNQSDQLQYPEYAQKEGIEAIISIPIKLHSRFIGVLRLYHYETWQISEQDLDSLNLFAENIGLAMMYTRLKNVLISIKHTIGDIHPVWLNRF
ncbi:MAG: GAF domain-containing protein [Desulfobacterales bacterium]|nr:GAF domain-containing protein [Desulfobacterales bacterium]MDJ0914054.1 GAF domain-containing protein [Desulfobacterales bacterium]